MNTQKKKISIIGLGYVGLPLAVEFGKNRSVVGFDINITRIKELQSGIDRTNECSSNELAAAKHLSFTSNFQDIENSEIYIITVPTPVDLAKQPDLKSLILASQTVANVLKKNDIVIYESTVYPGTTEEVCVPVLEKYSDLKFNCDFFVGYSPERINPGDKLYRLPNIKKLVSGSTISVAEEIDFLYQGIITAGTVRVKSIKAAEAAKVIENTQRDVNIALMNELSVIFNLLNIDTLEVLEAASSKWNFLNFRPGLVGGHCIGVDPYYLTYKSQSLGYHPEVILSGRRINDSMASYIARRTIKLMLAKKFNLPKSRVLILGLAFKENCSDMRNSKVFDIIAELKEYNVYVDVYDPLIDSDSCIAEHNIYCLSKLSEDIKYDAIIIAVAHDIFSKFGESGIKSLGIENAVIFDVKGILPFGTVDGRL
jgi:UDP-N-acetyl-D-galactosamine dehydrogenase